MLARAFWRGPSSAAAEAQLVDTNGASSTLAAAAASQLVWQLPELRDCVAAFLPPNEVALGLRLVDRSAARQFSGPEHTPVRLSEPVPHAEFVRHWSSQEAWRSLSLRRRHQLLCLLVQSGQLDNLAVAAAAAGCCLPIGLVRMATSYGHAHVAAWLRTQQAPDVGMPSREQLLAAGANTADYARWLHELVELQSCMLPADMKLLRLALATVGLGACPMPLLLHNGIGWPDSGEPPPAVQMLAWAAAGSARSDWLQHLELVEKSAGQARGTPGPCMAAAAALPGPLAAARLAFLRARGYPLSAAAVAAAAGSGSVEALHALRAMGCPATEGAARMAAAGGHVGALQALQHMGAPIAADTLRWAAYSGSGAAVEFLVHTLGTDRAPPSQRNPHRHRQQRQALTADVLAAAAASDSLELLQWLHALGCPLSEPVFDAAAKAGNGAALEWLAALDCPMPVSLPYEAAAVNGDLQTLRLLLCLGCRWRRDELVSVAEHEGKLSLIPGTFITSMLRGSGARPLQALLDLGCPHDPHHVRLYLDGRETRERFAADVKVWLQRRLKERRPFTDGPEWGMVLMALAAGGVFALPAAMRVRAVGRAAAGREPTPLLVGSVVAAAGVLVALVARRLAR